MARFPYVALAALLATGCATSSSVKAQVDPLAQRVSALEKGQAELKAQLADLAAKAEQSQEQQAAAQAKLTELSSKVQALGDDLTATAHMARSAEQAASESRAATIRAELAANQAAKAFELTQKRGRK